MKVKSIIIKNYRSVEDIKFEIHKLQDNSFSYGLIGVNEAGKSSILKAIALKDDLIKVIQKDFKDKSIPIELIYFLEPDENEITEFVAHFLNPESPINIDNIDFKEIKLILSYQYSTFERQNFHLEIKNKGNTEITTIQETLKQIIIDKTPKSIFWTAEDRYLISQPIELLKFAESPETISVPLRNCFSLSGITNIQERIRDLSDSTEKEELQTTLGAKVTEHIKAVWPNHPIKITFVISDGLINFHVKDENSNAKAKTADQRSDGFKQFVSFLLTISAQSKNEELSNSILLLDEPETHLHPQAQEYLLGELIKISKNDRNNIVFYATHSNYMIDKNDLSRNFKIKKMKDKTEIESFDKKFSSYASVTFEVFDIATNDYHNELYGAIQEREQLFSEKEFEKYLESKNIKIDKPYIKLKNASIIEKYDTTLPTKIRNIIHHPENTNNNFNISDLRKSIEILLKIYNDK